MSTNDCYICCCKCVNKIYVWIRFCCCLCGCCCTIFWLLLLWAFISLSISMDDNDIDTEHKEKNDYGIPFDSDINLKDIFQFFYDNANKNRKRPMTNYTIQLKLEDIINDKQHIIDIDENEYNIIIPGGIPNGYIINDESNGYNWKINVKKWDALQRWERINDNDCNLYHKKLITVNDILMGFQFNITMIDGTSKTIENINPIDYTNGLQIKHGGLTDFNAKDSYFSHKGNAYVQFDILYPKLSKKQKQRLKKFFKSKGKWTYNNDKHKEL
eukprot:160992_1